MHCRLTFLLLLVLHLCHSSVLFDECTVNEAGKDEKMVSTFSNIVHFDIAGNEVDSDTAITIENEEADIKIPFMNWTKVTCNFSNRTCKKDSDGDLGKYQDNQIDVSPKKKTIGIKNADYLLRCTKGLPNKELTKGDAVGFPRSNKSSETFKIVPEVEMELEVIAFGGKVSLCWDGDQIVVNEGDCQGLPPNKIHTITVDFAAKTIQNASGKTLFQNQNETSDKGVKFRPENDSGWIVQVLNETHRPETATDTTTTSGSQVSRAHSPGLIAAVVIFATSTIALVAYVIYTKRSVIRRRMSSTGNQSPPVNPVTSGGHDANDIGEETENDIYIPFNG